eukprot:5473465-Prymnesium_polylepis.1
MPDADPNDAFADDIFAQLRDLHADDDGGGGLSASADIASFTAPPAPALPAIPTVPQSLNVAVPSPIRVGSLNASADANAANGEGLPQGADLYQQQQQQLQLIRHMQMQQAQLSLPQQ